MIVVRVELHSANTRQVTELARMHISNCGGSSTRGDYSIRTLWGRSAEQLDKGIRQRVGTVKNYPRLTLHVWHLVTRALIATGYAGARELEQPSDMFSEASESIAP